MKDFIGGKLPFPQITMKAITNTLIIAILDTEDAHKGGGARLPVERPLKISSPFSIQHLYHCRTLY